MLTAMREREAKEEPRPRRGAEVHLDEWVAPDYVDERGFLRAGRILEWLDVVGALTASRHCRLPVVTATVDGAALGQPIRVGAHAKLVASIVHTSARSIGVRVCLHDGPRARQTTPLQAFMTFVGVNARGDPLPVPQFVPESATEAAGFREGALRRAFRRRSLAASGSLPCTAEPARWSTGNEPLSTLLLRTLRLAGDRLLASSQGPERSYIHKIELVRTGALSMHGTLRGGTLMRWVETAASLSARAFLGGVVARLVDIHGLTFLKPVRPGVFLHVHAIVAHTGDGRLSVGVRVESEDPLTGTTEQVLRGFLTYAPVVASSVPRLLLATDEARATFDEVERYLSLQRSIAIEADGL